MEIELTIKRNPRPYGKDPNQLLDYILRSLGFDRNLEVYREILMKLVRGPETSSDLATGIGKRTTTVYHIGKLLKAGLVVRKGYKYSLREETFERLIEEVKRDVDRVFEDLIEVARKLDVALHLPRR